MSLKTKRIGIIGLGIMGGGIASNFLKNGYMVNVWNRTKRVTDSLIKKGSVGCNTPKEVAQQSDVVFEVTANDKSSKSVWLGENGILAGSDKSKTLITNATLSVDWVDELARKCKGLKYTFFDMPMTGGRVGAEAGELTLLVGGDKDILEKISPVLKAISKKITYFGQAGQGIRYKLILNFLQAVHVIGFGQAMKIAKENNMDLKKVGDALVDRPGGTITALSWRDYQIEPNPINFSIEWIAKDLNYAKKFAKKIKSPLLDNVLKIYKSAVKRGLGNKDWASINTIK